MTANLPDIESNITSTNSGIQVKEIYDLLKKGDQETKLSSDKDIVLILGNTGSGKSTFTQYLTDGIDKLVSVEVPYSGDYVIVDSENKISQDATIISKTIFPEFVVDSKTNRTYYDCPGFSDSRSPAYEIAETYFIKKVIDSARRVKLLFVVSYHAVEHGADRKDFPLMLKHVVDFVKNADKFKNSVALVVTKVKNNYKGKPLKLISDNQVINAIGNYIERVKQDVNNNPQLVGLKSTASKKEILTFLNALLNKEGVVYTRIGIFRRPDEAGPLGNIELLKDGKASLQNMIETNITYAEVADEDFGYTVSSESKLHVNNLVEEIYNTMVDKLVSLGNETVGFYNLQEAQMTETGQLKELFKKVHDSFFNLQQNIAPNKFTQQIQECISNLKIVVSNHHIENLKKEEDYIKFLYLVSSQSEMINRSTKLAAGLNQVLKYFHESYLYYGFLTNLIEKLSEYDVQLNRNNYITINIDKLTDLSKPPLGSMITDYSDIKDIKPNTPKLNLLNRILDLQLKYKVKTVCTDTNKLIVKGQFIILSEIKTDQCDGEIKIIQLFALDKIFIDTSLDLTGKEVQFAVAAPEWEIVGNPKIILDGKSGAEYYNKASSGSGGLAGNPGGPAGSFFGIGQHFINDQFLEISANGGKGGKGQDGGDGAEGVDGKQCTWCRPEQKILVTVFYNSGDTILPGEKGGDGGDGGVGGWGGSRGNIIIKQVGSQPTGYKIKIRGYDGQNGDFGSGGQGGEGGRYYVVKSRNYVLLVSTEKTEAMDSWAPRGRSGKRGNNRMGLKDTWRAAVSLSPSTVKLDFESYLNENLKKSPKESYLKNFLQHVETHVMKKRYAIVSRMVKTELNSSKLDKYSNDSLYLKLLNHSQYTDVDEKLNELSINNTSKRETLSIKDLENRRLGGATPYATSTATSLGRNSFFNKIFNMAFGGFISFKPWAFFGNVNKFGVKEDTLRMARSDCCVTPLSLVSPEMSLPSQYTDANLDELYPLMHTHSNLLLWDLIIKMLTGKNTPQTCDKINRRQKSAEFASQLAYSYYTPKGLSSKL